MTDRRLQRLWTDDDAQLVDAAIWNHTPIETSRDLDRATTAVLDALTAAGWRPPGGTVPLADHPALEWLAIHLWQTARDGHGSMELHSRLSGWLADRQATGLDAPPETAGGETA